MFLNECFLSFLCFREFGLVSLGIFFSSFKTIHSTKIMLRNCSVQNLDDNLKRKIDFLPFLKQKGNTTLITNHLLLNMNDVFSNPILI